MDRQTETETETETGTDSGREREGEGEKRSYKEHTIFFRSPLRFREASEDPCVNAV